MFEIRFDNSTLRVGVLFLVTAVAVLTLDGGGYAPLCLLLSLLHECGHLAAFALFGRMPRLIEIGLGGIRIEHPPEGLTYRQNLLVSAAGPAVNFLSAGVLCLFHEREAALAALLLGGFQLLPVLSLDGGQMLLCLLSSRGDPDRAERTLRVVSVVLLCLATVPAALLFLRSRNASLLLAVLYLLLRQK